MILLGINSPNLILIQKPFRIQINEIRQKRSSPHETINDFSRKLIHHRPDQSKRKHSITNHNHTRLISKVTYAAKERAYQPASRGKDDKRTIAR